MGFLQSATAKWVGFWNGITAVVPIPRHRLAAVLSIVACAIAAGATYWWLQNSSDTTAEPRSQFYVAIVWLVTSILELLIPSDPGWEELRAKRAKADADILNEVLPPIEEERLDFLQIRDKKGQYNSPAHRKAVEVYSFQQLRPAIERLQALKAYTVVASKILSEIDRNLVMEKGRDVKKLLPLVEKLIARIKKDLIRLERLYRGLV